MEEKVIRYKKDDLTVLWKPKTCIHSEKCWKGLSEVFKPKEKPWIQLDGATKERIMEQVNQCPSGALSFEIDGASKTEKKEAIQAKISPNGPIIIQGEVCVVLANGEKVNHTQNALCRCGASSNKPYCDGTHSKVGFTD